MSDNVEAPCSIAAKNGPSASVFLPSNATELSTFIRFIRDLEKCEQWDIRLAIKGGGHTAWDGAANEQGGIVIDLKNMTGVIVDSNAATAIIGGGETWNNVYKGYKARLYIKSLD